MDLEIFTPRLRLSLVTKAERGSDELKWIHDLWSDEQSSWWSIRGRSKSVEDTEKVVKGMFPTDNESGKGYGIVYAAHRIPESATSPGNEAAKPTELKDRATEFIGLINVKSLTEANLKLPDHFNVPTGEASSTLTTEIAYMFLPTGWGKGYATESINAVFEVCKRNRSFWAPYERVWVRALVNEGNPASLRVMEKTGMSKMGIYEWTGKAVFLAGQWRERDHLYVFSKYLLE